MNRNTNAHFSELPNVEVSRSTFDRSHSVKFSGNVGDVIPFFYDDILPGDTVQMDTSKLIRFQTMLTPFMDNMYCDVYWFFVPNRIVWDHWINLMGENTESAWTPTTQYSVPVIKVPAPDGYGPYDSTFDNNNKVGTILDYLGYPVCLTVPNPNYDSTSDLSAENQPTYWAQLNNVEVNALPIRGYSLIMNEFFRDENLTDPLNIYKGDNAVTASTGSTYVDDVPQGGLPFKAAKFADYFTSCLPQAQKGDPVSFNISFGNTDVPVYARGKLVPNAIDATNANNAFVFHGKYDDTNYYQRVENTSHHFTAEESAGFNYGISSGTYLRPVNLWANLNSASLSFSVNDFRYAFQMQKLLERDSRSGTRYIECLKAHFSVDSPDQRLQRPEYLGGNRFPISVNQVSNTAQSEADFLGDLGANSVTTDVHSDFVKSFTEHGMLFGLMVVRYDHTYSQGLEKFWKRSSRFDYYWPVFANIGEQPVDKSELFLTGTGTFGYQEAWADYRYKPNRLCGEMRPYVQNSLASWHLGDDYNSVPSLSDSWIREDKNNVNRVLAVTSSVSNQFWADFYMDFRHTRPMPVYSIPGLIDHN